MSAAADDFSISEDEVRGILRRQGYTHGRYDDSVKQKRPVLRASM